jgi:hypothetical protein
VVIIPAGVPHGFSAIEKSITYEVVRVDQKILPLKILTIAKLRTMNIYFWQLLSGRYLLAVSNSGRAGSTRFFVANRARIAFRLQRIRVVPR